MNIEYRSKFVDSFTKILDYISLDSSNAALHFKQDIKNKIENIQYMPLQYKKSIYFDDDNIRDLIFKGYTIVYEINPNMIVIIGIKKYKENF